MKFKFSQQRLLDGLLCLAVTLFLAVGFYVELALGVSPCLLCLLQRASWLALWICFFLLACFNWPRWFRSAIEGIIFAWGILGVFWASRQVWLQVAAANAPDKHFACLPNAYFLIEHTPASTIMQMALAGTDDCALVHWTLGGISMAWWSLVAFAIVLSILLGRWVRRHYF